MVATPAAIDTFTRRWVELRMQLMFGALEAADQAELERLQAAMLACLSVAAYLAAQGRL